MLLASKKACVWVIDRSRLGWSCFVSMIFINPMLKSCRRHPEGALCCKSIARAADSRWRYGNGEIAVYVTLSLCWFLVTLLILGGSGAAEAVVWHKFRRLFDGVMGVLWRLAWLNRLALN